MFLGSGAYGVCAGSYCFDSLFCAFAEGEKELARNQCLPDKLQPHDIARMVLFLASDDAAMCTAQEFKVDAGWV